jgi:hypothetical protein
MRTRLAALIALLLSIWLMAPGTAGAGTSEAAFDFHVADQFLHDATGSALGAVAMADNGDTITVIGSGQFDAAAKTASGSGTFVHHQVASDNDITGTWTATSLVSYQSYGCGGDGFPANFCGGLAKVNIVGTPDFDPSLHIPSVLWIDCLIGSKVPAGASEGVRLLAKDVINFNQTVESGFTLFIQH